MKQIHLLPSNSAAGMQESSESEVELFLLTDAAWQKGDYPELRRLFHESGHSGPETAEY
jgi:hypothetical protein